MSSKIRIKHRLTGAAGSPTGVAGYQSGELVINFTPAAPATPELWAYDGAAWKQLNPPAAAPTVGNVSLPGGTPGSASGIGAAWTAKTPKPSDPIVIASFAGSAYVRTGSGGSDGDWTSLGSAAQFASAADILAGTSTDKGIAPDQLRLHTLNAPTGGTNKVTTGDVNHLVRLAATGALDPGFIPKASNSDVLGGSVDVSFITPKSLQSRTTQTPNATPTKDVNKFVRLMTTGKINNGFLDGIAAGPAAGANSGKPVLLDATGRVAAALLPVLGTTLKGAHDFTAATPPAGIAKGDIYFSNAAGGVDAAYTGIAGQTIKSGDMVMYDGTNYHLIPIEQDLAAYVTKAGHNAIAKDMVMTWAAPTAMKTVLNGSNATRSQIENFNLENCLIDGGTF